MYVVSSNHLINSLVLIYVCHPYGRKSLSQSHPAGKRQKDHFWPSGQSIKPELADESLTSWEPQEQFDGKDVRNTTRSDDFSEHFSMGCFQLALTRLTEVQRPQKAPSFPVNNAEGTFLLTKAAACPVEWKTPSCFHLPSRTYLLPVLEIRRQSCRESWPLLWPVLTIVES